MGGCRPRASREERDGREWSGEWQLAEVWHQKCYLAEAWQVRVVVGCRVWVGWEAATGSHQFKITQESDSSLKRGTR